MNKPDLGLPQPTLTHLEQEKLRRDSQEAMREFREKLATRTKPKATDET